MDKGRVVDFIVVSGCPFCKEDTDINEEELTCGEAVCQHCDSLFVVKSEKITRFDVVAECPHCKENTDVDEGELNCGELGCQHCGKSYLVSE